MDVDPEALKYQTGEPPTPDQMADDVLISSDTHREQRLPPGQSRTRKWPVLHASSVPEVTVDNWTLSIEGCVETPIRLNWKQFSELKRVKVFADFHCVTKWSRLGNLWEGVSTEEICNLVRPQTQARHVIAYGYDGQWSTNLPMNDFQASDALLCDRHEGELLSPDHGGPVRLIIPQRYAWKSAKWLQRLVFTPSDQPGFWEKAGYHNNANPWNEERFSGAMPASYAEEI